MDERAEPINLNALRLFRKVAELGSMTRAADALFVTQPAVSKAIRLLERSVGLPLVGRTGRAVHLTEAGLILAAHADRVFNAAADAREAMWAISGLTQGRLVIGASTTIGNYLVPRLLGAFHAAYPAISLQARIGNTQAILDDLDVFRIELALIEGPIDDPGLTSLPLATDELVLLLPPGHPWSDRASVALPELQGAPFLPREHGSGTRQVVDRVLAAYEVTPAIAMELGHSEAIKGAVAAGLGVSILSRWCVRAELDRATLISRPFDGLRITRELLMVRRADDRPSPALVRFIELLARETDAWTLDAIRSEHPPAPDA